MNNKILEKTVADFIKKLKNNKLHADENWQERLERTKFYKSYTAKRLLTMTEEEFAEYISKLWSMIVWGNKKYIVDKLIKDNGFENIKKKLSELLYGSSPIEKRWDSFTNSIKGLGPSTISELLCYVNPKEYILFNKFTIMCYQYLDIPDMPQHHYQYTGKKYIEACKYAKEIAKRLNSTDNKKEYDLLDVDYFLWDEIRPLAEKEGIKQPVINPKTEPPITPKQSKSLHDEVKEKLVEIGMMLGFESKAEVQIATGAVVDAVWEANIGNMGKVIYVFEVQSKGSVDSLLLNLMKAQNNPAVQAIIAVSDEQQLQKIKKESRDLSGIKNLRTWEINDVIIVYDSLIRAHESINKLDLVPKSFT